MQLQPLYNNLPFDLTALKVKPVAHDKERIQAAVERAGVIQGVTDETSFTAAKRMLSELKGIQAELDAAKKLTKMPGQQFLNAVEQLAKELGAGLATERERIESMANGYVAKLEAAERAREAERRRKAEEERKQIEEQIRAAKAAKDAQALEEAQLAAELAADIEKLGARRNTETKIAGGRVEHRFLFRLIDIKALVGAGLWQCVRFELDHLGCNDVVKAQIEKGIEPFLPGVEITQTTKVHMRASSRIEL